jgi:hypothetical protein
LQLDHRVAPGDDGGKSSQRRLFASVIAGLDPAIHAAIA